MILIFTSGSAEEGFGHVYRTVSIVSELKRRLIAVHCIVRFNTQVVGILERNRVEYSCVNSVDEFLGFFSSIDTVSIVIDSRQDLSLEIELTKRRGISVVQIDCLDETRRQADINIYPNPHFMFDQMDWSGYNGKVVGGADYTVIHSRFLEMRSQLPNAIDRQRILISMGGSDPNRLTPLLMTWLEKMSWPVEVVIGPGMPNGKDLELLSDSLNITHHSGHDDLAPLMSRSGVLITGLGVSIYEAAVLKLPAIVIQNFERDAADAMQLALVEGVFPLGFFKDVNSDLVRSAVNQVIDNYDHYSSAVGELVDGLGARRIVDLLVS